MDYEKFVNELLDGPLGDFARERFVTEMLTELENYTNRFGYESDEDRERDRAWAASVAEWLRDEWI